MRGGLVGDDVDRRVLLEQRGEHLGRVAEHADRQRLAGVARLDGERHGVLERVGLYVEVAVLDAALDPALVDVDADRDAVVHRHGERLGAAHAAEAGGQRDGAGERAVEPLVGDGGEGLEGALEDALGADVDPRARRSSGRTSSGRGPRADGTPPSWPSRRPGWSWRSARAAPTRGCGRRRPACRSARASSRRRPGWRGCAPGRRTTPSCARPCRCRRTPPARRGSRRSPGRGCSSASAAAPRSATSARSARCRGRRGWGDGGCRPGCRWSLQFSDHCFD